MINNRYSLLLLAYSLSAIGDWVYRLAVPIILFERSGSPLALSISYALTSLPMVIVTPFGGVLADALDRRTLLVYGDFASGVLVGYMALMAVGLPNLTFALYSTIFVIASLSAIYHPAFHSFLPMLVRDADLAKANSYISAADNVVDVIAPIISGSVIAVMGTGNALFFDAASFFVSAIAISLIRGTTSSAIITSVGARLNEWHNDLRAGIVYALAHPVVRYSCILFIFVNLGLGMFNANFMYYLIGHVGLNAVQVGTTLALSGIGAILGSLLAPRLGTYVREGALILNCTIIAGLATLLLFLVVSPLTVAVVWGSVLAANSVVIVTYFTLRQRVVPSEFLRRTIAITRPIGYAAIPVGSVLGGWLVQYWGIDYAILLSGAIVTGAGVFGWFTPLNGRTVPIPIHQVK
jgi:MFS family permease